MDANVNSEILNQLHTNIDLCQKSLNDCILTIKAEFKIANQLLAGEQFERFKSQADNVCQAINVTVDALSRSKEFLNRLSQEVIDYNGTKYGG